MQIKFASIRQVSLHPSPEFELPSSHSSPPPTRRLPQSSSFVQIPLRGHQSGASPGSDSRWLRTGSVEQV
jgi:hypothetical protein